MRPQQAQVHARLSREREDQEDDSGAERIRQGYENGLERHPARGGERRNRGDHRAGAGGEKKPEAGAEEKTASGVARSAASQRLEWPLDDAGERRKEEGEADQQDDPDRDVAQEVIR